MPSIKHSWSAMESRQKVTDAIDILSALGFGPKQCNETAGYVFRISEKVGRGC